MGGRIAARRGKIMVPDPSPTGGDPISPQPEPSRGAKTITCEACESVLHGSGDVKKKSDYLKKLEKSDERCIALQEKIDTLERKITELQTNPPAPIGDDTPPEPTPTPKTKKGLLMQYE
jgi:hypothetical protein